MSLFTSTTLEEGVEARQLAILSERYEAATGMRSYFGRSNAFSGRVTFQQIIQAHAEVVTSILGSAENPQFSMFGVKSEMEAIFDALEPIHGTVPLEAFLGLFTGIAHVTHHEQAVASAKKRAEMVHTYSSKLKFIIVEFASDLPRMDLIGSVDSYVKVSVVGPDGAPVSRCEIEPSHGHTSTKKSTFDPIWGESFACLIPSPTTERRVRLTVMDWDRASSHDIIGHVDLRDDGTHKYPLVLQPKVKQRRGKAASLTVAQKTIETPMVLFSDFVSTMNSRGRPCQADTARHVISIPLQLAGFSSAYLRISYNYALASVTLSLNAVHEQRFETLSTHPLYYIAIDIKRPHQGYTMRKTESRNPRNGERSVQLQIDHLSILTSWQDVTILTSRRDPIFEDCFETIAHSHGFDGMLTYEEARATCRDVMWVDETQTAYFQTFFGGEHKPTETILQAPEPANRPVPAPVEYGSVLDAGAFFSELSSWLHGEDVPKEEPPVVEEAPVVYDDCGILFEHDWDTAESCDFSLMLTKPTGTGTPNVAIDLLYSNADTATRYYSFFAGDLKLKGGHTVVAKVGIYDVPNPVSHANLNLTVDNLVDTKRISVQQLMGGPISVIPGHQPA